jgi:pantetheine-phosphate adenylyltransferase
MRIAIFPGSFDPFTKGHEDVVRRSLGLFDEVIIALGDNSGKSRYFPSDWMAGKIRGAFAGEPRVRVEIYQGLTAHFAALLGARFIIRGLRNTTDFEYENSIARVNHDLNPELETVFLITSPSLSAIRSTLVRELHRYGAPVGDYLPYSIAP